MSDDLDTMSRGRLMTEVEQLRDEIDRLRELHDRRLAENKSLVDEIKRLRDALRFSPCPQPIDDDDYYVEDCVLGKRCWCGNARALQTGDLGCDHDWVLAVNDAVTSGEFCPKCNAVRAVPEQPGDIDGNNNNQRD